MSAALDSRTKADLLDQFRRELSIVKLSLIIIGEKSEFVSDLVAKRATLLEKIDQLEKELFSKN